LPTDSGGNYSLPSGSTAVGGTTALATTHNTPLSDIATGLTDRVMRNGSAPMIAPLKLIDGTQAVPALTFTSDPSIGLYKTPTGVAFSGLLSGILPIGLGPVPWSRTTAPPLWVLANGQQLSRANYPDLWAVAEAEIAAGNTLYNNGNGSTTFGIADVRGRLLTGLDGGTNRLPDASTLGATFGSALATLVQANLPNASLAVTIPSGQGGHYHTYLIYYPVAQTAAGANPQSVSSSASSVATSTATLPQMTGTASLGGSSTPFSIVQPGITTNFIIYAGA